MHPIRPQPLRQRDGVIDDERHVALGADRLQRLSQPRRRMLIDVLHPELKSRHRPRVERRREPVGKAAGDVERRDKVELARWSAHVAPKGGGEVGIERSERVFNGHDAGSWHAQPPRATAAA